MSWTGEGEYAVVVAACEDPTTDTQEIFERLSQKVEYQAHDDRFDVTFPRFGRIMYLFGICVDAGKLSLLVCNHC